MKKIKVIKESLIDKPRKALQKELGITAVVTSGDTKDDQRVLDVLIALAASAKKLPKSSSFGFKPKGKGVEMSFGGLHKDGGAAIEKVIKPILKKLDMKVKFTEPRSLGGRNLGRTAIFEGVINEAPSGKLKTTDENPLVRTYNKGAFKKWPEEGITGHVNLSTAASMGKFDPADFAKKVVKAGADSDKRIKAGKIWIQLSIHHKKAVNDDRNMKESAQLWQIAETTTTSDVPDTAFKASGTFRGHPYFDCPQGVFDNCFKGKKKGSHWKKWLGDDKFSENIKNYIKKNPKKTFLFRDEKSKAFIFARKFY